MLERPPIDWTQQVQWNTGDPVKAVERSYGHVIIMLGPTYPKELEPLMAMKHFKDSLVVYEDTGEPGVPLHMEAPACWIENVDKKPNPWAEVAGSF